MILKVLLPTEVLIEEKVTKVNAEAENGHFGILPHHIDFVAALVPGILSYQKEDSKKEVFLAVNEGILVKCDREVLVSTQDAIQGEDLGTLKQAVTEQFKVLDEKEKLTRSALAKFEANMVRRFRDLKL